MEPLAGRYAFVREIGKGGFGCVEEYRDVLTGREVAIKTIPPYYVQQEVKRVIREVDIMSFLYEAHPHVITFEQMFVTRCLDGMESQVAAPRPPADDLLVQTNPVYRHMNASEREVYYHEALRREVASIRPSDPYNLHIVMRVMKGDLIYFIKVLSSESHQRQLGLSRHYLRTVAVVFAFQMLFGLDFLHGCGIVHRDIKPDNVLVALSADDAYQSVVWLADLGLARDAQESETFYVCTRYYRPPEAVMTTQKNGTALDIWSIGCVFYEMCTGKTLFTMATALDQRGAWDGGRASSQLEVILNTVGTPSKVDIDMYMPPGNARMYLQRSAARSSRLRALLRDYWILPTDSATEKELWIDLILRCLAFFPQQRPTAAELCTHPLFVRYDIIFQKRIHQKHTSFYQPTFSEDQTRHALREDNKSRVLQLVQRVMLQTYPRPPHLEPVPGCDDGYTQADDENDEIHNFEDEAEEVDNGAMPTRLTATGIHPLPQDRGRVHRGNEENEYDVDNATFYDLEAESHSILLAAPPPNPQQRQVVPHSARMGWSSHVTVEDDECSSRHSPWNGQRQGHTTTHDADDYEDGEMPTCEPGALMVLSSAHSTRDVHEDEQQQCVGGGGMTPRVPPPGSPHSLSSWSESSMRWVSGSVPPTTRDPPPPPHHQLYRPSVNQLSTLQHVLSNGTGSSTVLETPHGVYNSYPSVGVGDIRDSTTPVLLPQESSPLQLQPSTTGALGHHYGADATDDGNWDDWGLPPLSPSLSTLIASINTDFPQLTDGELRRKYQVLDCSTEAGVQSALNQVLEEMNVSMYEPVRSKELRTLLNYYSFLRYNMNQPA